MSHIEDNNIPLLAAFSREALTLRDQLLRIIDLIERLRGIQPRTSELREMWKRGKIGSAASDLAAKN